jgi:hypothetical protein
MPCSFAPFNNLPSELQDIIWEYTLFDSRIISAEHCFHEWWHHRMVPLLMPAALRVCHSSRSLAKSILKRTLISVPGIPGWRIIYINQASDLFCVTKKDVQKNVDMSTFIQNLALVNRVLISNITRDTSWFSKRIIRYFDQFSNLREVILTDRGRYVLESCRYKASSKLQHFFEDRNRNVLVMSS